MLFALLLAIPAFQNPTLEAFPADGTLVERPGLPGTLCVFGARTEVVLSSGGRQVHAVAGTAEVGEGRAFAITHNGYLSPKFFTGDDAWMAHALEWLRGEAEPGVVMFLGGEGGALAGTLMELGYRIQPFAEEALPEVQLLIVEGEGPQPAARLAALQSWLEDGGAVLAAICPWGWQQIHGGRGWNLKQHLAANQILGPHGLLFSDGYADPSVDGQFVVDRAACEGVDCRILVDRIAAGELPDDLGPLESAMRFLPEDDTLLLPRLHALLPDLEAGAAPTPEHPLRTRQDPLARLAVVAMDRVLATATPEAPRRAPGAEAFPGNVSEGAMARTTERVLAADRPGWQSTGLYVAPGTVVELRFEGDGAGWRTRIGAHADKIWHKDRWPRWPAVVRQGDLEERITSPFGGLLYFEAEAEVASDLAVEVVGAYAAPWWRSGGTSPEQWRTSREAPGPWAELQGQYLILTVPSASVRKLEDPEALMAWWDQVVLEQFTLAGEEPPRRPERFVTDVLISAGYMHAGYPIMMHLDVAESRPPAKGGGSSSGKPRPAVLLDLEELQTKGNWGCFHELGHNRQAPIWTFGGTGEVTNNLFSLHSGEVMSGISPWENPWLQNQKKAGARYLLDGADFSIWKRKPGIALLCYAQVQREFGWEPFREVFALARTLEGEAIPRTDLAKRGFWVRALSMACGRDLRAFHRTWGWPLPEALDGDPELDALKEWHPDYEELKR